MNIQDCKSDEEINEKIELSLDIQRHWINFQFPRFLISLNDIANDVFKKYRLEQCDYSYFASMVECYFISPYVVPLDEYGLPIQISEKIGKIIQLSPNIDEALQQISRFNPMMTTLPKIEKEFIKEFQEYI